MAKNLLLMAHKLSSTERNWTYWFHDKEAYSKKGFNVTANDIMLVDGEKVLQKALTILKNPNALHHDRLNPAQERYVKSIIQKLREAGYG